MAALQCDICGGKLMGRPGGIFECDSCGMEYDTAWAKAKIQEIKGTVKVEGTVQVAGTVKIEGGVNIDSLLKRGILCLEDELWKDALHFFDEALNLDAECADAYFGKVCAKKAAKNLETLLTQRRNVSIMADFQKGLRFSDPVRASQIREVISAAEAKFAAEDERIRIEKDLAERQKEELRIKKREEKIEELQMVRKQLEPFRGRIAAGRVSSLGIKEDGSVTVYGITGHIKKVIERWEDIISLATDMSFTVGLKLNGTAVVTAGSTFMSGRNKGEKEEVSQWTDLVAVAVGDYHTVGLKSDGTVVAAGSNLSGQCNVSDWTNIVAISAGFCHTVGLRADGSVVAVGENDNGECKTEGWHDITAIAAGSRFTVGLRKDGTVVRAGAPSTRSDSISYWKDIVDICACGCGTVGLQKDGRVIFTEDLDCSHNDLKYLQDIVAIASGNIHILGLKRDGTVVAVGGNHYEQCNINGMRLFRDSAKLRPLARTTKRPMLDLKQERERLSKEHKELPGLFAGKRRKEIEDRLAEIEAELKGLK